eukprot:TRINITY_DN5658_c0_g1_i12.p1 TRINITY_DN5658_c0_g1~~TRINITY_DN5658_c0_g1_i12.p1  ORF type:complete len:102 (-),score=36.03 TRINITY_DN5658_c0_g1_i12:373-648(-)
MGAQMSLLHLESDPSTDMRFILDRRKSLEILRSFHNQLSLATEHHFHFLGFIVDVALLSRLAAVVGSALFATVSKYIASSLSGELQSKTQA